ncbi:MAG: SsrA-binding protein SmpB [Rhodothermia bacterium]|nr:SsrA-binding protein SmpB [Rhodothermia bacterium]
MSEGIKLVTSNRKAFHDYRIEDKFEAGIELRGTEVKSLRMGRANLQDSFCVIERGEVTMMNCHISPYSQASHFNHDPLRPRKLLLHRRQIAQLDKAVRRKGYTIIPLRVYFKGGYAKVEIGLARGKRQYDKRADIAERETKRRLERVNRRGDGT